MVDTLDYTSAEHGYLHATLLAASIDPRTLAAGPQPKRVTPLAGTVPPAPPPRAAAVQPGRPRRLDAFRFALWAHTLGHFPSVDEVQDYMRLATERVARDWRSDLDIARHSVPTRCGALTRAGQQWRPLRVDYLRFALWCRARGTVPSVDDIKRVSGILAPTILEGWRDDIADALRTYCLGATP